MSGAELAETLAGAVADQVTVLRPLEVHSHEGLWRRAVWCAAAPWLTPLQLPRMRMQMWVHAAHCSLSSWAGLRTNRNQLDAC